MAYVAPTNVSTGDVLTASRYNADVVANAVAIRTAQINVQSTAKTDTYSVSLAANAYSSNVTGMDVAITPTASTSKVLLIVNLSLTAESGVTTGAFRLMRGASAIAVGDAASNRARVTMFHSGYDNSGGANGFTFTFLDSPATTSATTYGVQIYNISGLTRTHYLNRGYTDTDNNQNMRQASSIVAIEVPV